MRINRHNFPQNELQLCRYIVIPGKYENRLYREIEKSEYNQHKEYKEFEGSRWILLVEHKDINYLYTFIDERITTTRKEKLGQEV